MAVASGLAIAGFSDLGSIFDYPAVLDEPTTEILDSLHQHQSAVMAWFAVLCVSAALLASVGILLDRLARRPLGTWTAITGVAASIVQVVGSRGGSCSSPA